MERPLRHWPSRLAVLRLSTSVLVLGLAACGGHVVKVAPNPVDGADVMVDGVHKRHNRWNVEPGEHQLEAQWPDGKTISALIMVRRDVELEINHAGVPGMISGIDQNLPKKGQPAAAAAPVPTQPQPAEPAAAAELTPEQAFAQAKTLFDEGEKAFELADFDVAITKFKGAYELLRGAESGEYDKVLLQVMYNLAVVYERSYAVTPEIGRLRKAKVMYENYDRGMGRGAPEWDGGPDQEELRAHLQELQTRVEGLESGP